MTIKIVPIRPEHIAGFHRTLDYVARERRYLSFLEGPAIDTSRAFVLDNIKRGFPQFVAVTGGGEVVGWCDVTGKTRPIYAHTGVLGMGILPDFRRQGIGTRLIRSAIASAAVIGLHRVELTVRESNTGAIELYKKVGFETEGLSRDAVQVDGAYENVVCMAILL
jgi:ribosomal protein S18 acetylase RimI-like enzyme